MPLCMHAYSGPVVDPRHSLCPGRVYMPACLCLSVCFAHSLTLFHAVRVRRQSVDAVIAAMDLADETVGAVVLARSSAGHVIKGATKDKLVERLVVMGASYGPRLSHCKRAHTHKKTDTHAYTHSRACTHSRADTRTRALTRLCLYMGRSGVCPCPVLVVSLVHDHQRPPSHSCRVLSPRPYRRPAQQVRSTPLSHPPPLPTHLQPATSEYHLGR
jgi:hypothetical protein